MTPNTLIYSMPYSDGSGTKMIVEFNASCHCVRITSCGGVAELALEDFEWLHEALENVGECVEATLNGR